MDTIHRGGKANSRKPFEMFQNNPDAIVAGQGASAFKYDILSALLVMATNASDSKARLAVRLTLVITARFNWRQGTFNVGLRELARMWAVTERTAKRDTALMRSIGWISVYRPAARGRVTQYRICFAALLKDTIPYWNAVGPDFATRMGGYAEPASAPPDNVVPIHAKSVTVPAQDGSIWSDISCTLNESDPAIYAAWFANILMVEREVDTLVLAAPNRFSAAYIQTHLQTQLLSAAITTDSSLRHIQIICADDLK